MSERRADSPEPPCPPLRPQPRGTSRSLHRFIFRKPFPHEIQVQSVHAHSPLPACPGRSAGGAHGAGLLTPLCTASSGSCPSQPGRVCSALEPCRSPDTDRCKRCREQRNGSPGERCLHPGSKEPPDPGILTHPGFSSPHKRKKMNINSRCEH